jgi:O-antigen ligase
VLVGVPGVGFDFTHLPREVLFALTAAVLAWSLPRRVDRLDKALLVVGAATLLSAVGALTWAWAWRPTLMVLAAVVCALGLRDRDNRPQWLAWQGAALVVLAVIGMFEALGFAALAPHGRAPASLMGQRNTLAHLLALGSPVLWHLSAHAGDRRARLVWSLGALSAAFMVVVTRSRAAWLALPLQALVYVVMNRRGSWRAPFPALLGVLAALLAPVRLVWNSTAPYADTLTRLVDANSGSGAGRLEQWSQSLTLVPSSPLLGLGPGNWFVAWAPWATSERTNRFVNSDWVGLLVERGALGVLAVLTAAVDRKSVV